MEKNDNENRSTEFTDHDLMMNEVYQGDIELLYLDCCFGELMNL